MTTCLRHLHKKNKKLKKRRCECNFDVKESIDTKRCIICQTDTGERLVSGDVGRQRIRDAATKYGENDIVAQRLKLVDDTFVYHMTSACYLKTIHKDQ